MNWDTSVVQIQQVNRGISRRKTRGGRGRREGKKKATKNKGIRNKNIPNRVV